MNVPKLQILEEARAPMPARPSGSMVPVLVVGAAAGLIAAGSCLALALRIGSVASDIEEKTLLRAGVAFEREMELAQAELTSQVRVMGDDARVRTTLATPGIDNETIRDLFRDLQRSTGVSIIGVLESGKVRTCIGNNGLARADLSGSGLTRDAWEQGRSSGLWALKDELIAIAMAPIRLASDPPRLLMIGRKLGTDEIEAVERASGATGGLLVNGSLVAGQGELLARASSLSPGTHSVQTPEPARMSIASIEGVSIPVWTVWVTRAGGDAGRIVESRWLAISGFVGATVAVLAIAILFALGRRRR